MVAARHLAAAACLDARPGVCHRLHPGHRNPDSTVPVVALGLRLNMPAIQAANYAAMPFQIALIFPFVRLGGWLFSSSVHPAFNASLLGHQAPSKLIWASGSLAGEALAAWLVTAVPMVLLLTLVLTALLRRVPMLASAEAGD